MNAKFIKQEDVAQLYGNIEELYKQVVCSGKTVQEYLGKECVVLDTNIPIEDFSLDMSESNPVLTDLENVKRVYKAMMGLIRRHLTNVFGWRIHLMYVKAI